MTDDGLNEFDEAALYDQSSAEVGESHSEFAAYLASQIDFSSVPDADEISPNSPVDPAAPQTDVVHGTDLLNGAGAEETE
ncbi:MAG: hypothetical protein K6T85_13560 [Gorillibacterium sp.]|nr:hypothetical protein [Gorillibacterium sp.]